MALEIVTEGKNDKTKNSYQTRENGTRQVSCFVVHFFFFFFFNRQYMHSFMRCFYNPFIESTENETLVVFRFFKVIQSKQRQLLSYCQLSSENENKKNAQLNFVKRSTTQIQVERAVYKVQTYAIGNWQSCYWTSKRKGS